MRMTRRTLLKGSAMAGGVAVIPVAANAVSKPACVVFDSRNFHSRALAFKMRGPAIDVATEDANLWRNLRSGMGIGRVEGLTSWSDWVLVRGLLEEKGLRVKQEARVGGLFRWTMA